MTAGNIPRAWRSVTLGQGGTAPADATLSGIGRETGHELSGFLRFCHESTCWQEQNGGRVFSSLFDRDERASKTESMGVIRLACYDEFAAPIGCMDCDEAQGRPLYLVASSGGTEDSPRRFQIAKIAG